VISIALTATRFPEYLICYQNYVTTGDERSLSADC